MLRTGQRWYSIKAVLFPSPPLPSPPGGKVVSLVFVDCEKFYLYEVETESDFCITQGVLHIMLPLAVGSSANRQ